MKATVVYENYKTETYKNITDIKYVDGYVIFYINNDDCRKWSSPTQLIKAINILF